MTAASDSTLLPIARHMPQQLFARVKSEVAEPDAHGPSPYRDARLEVSKLASLGRGNYPRAKIHRHPTGTTIHSQGLTIFADDPQFQPEAICQCHGGGFFEPDEFSGLSSAAFHVGRHLRNDFLVIEPLTHKWSMPSPGRGE